MSRDAPTRGTSAQPRAEERALRDADMFYKLVLMSISMGNLELATLLAVARLGDDAYGLAVRRDLVERTERDHSVGAVYTTLQRLEDKGLIKSHASEPLPVRGGRSRRHYTLTSAGTRALRDAKREATAMWSGVQKPMRPRLA